MAQPLPFTQTTTRHESEAVLDQLALSQPVSGLQTCEWAKPGSGVPGPELPKFWLTLDLVAIMYFVVLSY